MFWYLQTKAYSVQDGRPFARAIINFMIDKATHGRSVSTRTALKGFKEQLIVTKTQLRNIAI